MTRRKFLWHDLIDVVGHYREAEASNTCVMLYAIEKVVAIIIAGGIVDYLRIVVHGRPVCKWLSHEIEYLYKKDDGARESKCLENGDELCVF